MPISLPVEAEKNPMKHKQLPTIGWREWLDLPELGIAQIKAKIDTGARSSTLHAFHIEGFQRGGREMVRFQVHPYQRDNYYTVTAEAELVEWRHIRNSGGQWQLRPVIHTAIELGGRQWHIELTLTNRDLMGFRMLVGRQALRRRFLVNPGRSYLLGKMVTQWD